MNRFRQFDLSVFLLITLSSLAAATQVIHSSPKETQSPEATDSQDELKHVLQVRRIALDQFSPNKLPSGTISADVEQYLVPIYLHHRYQIQATAKLIGGMMYDYGGDAVQTSLRPVNFADQLVATRTILNSMSPEQLVIDKRIAKSIGVKPYKQVRDQESFPRNSGRTIDPLAAAKVSADMAISELLQHERLEASPPDAIAPPPGSPIGER